LPEFGWLRIAHFLQPILKNPPCRALLPKARSAIKPMTPGEYTIAVLVIFGISAVAVYRMILWVAEAPLTIDPWDKEIDAAANREDAIPLCHHCLTGQEHNGWFCPECGSTVGQYSNYMPYIYVFSQGELLRAGVTEKFRRSTLIRVGFMLFSLTMYMSLFFFPVILYWVNLFDNLNRTDTPATENAP
jgi:hypothetical protein